MKKPIFVTIVTNAINKIQAKRKPTHMICIGEMRKRPAK